MVVHRLGCDMAGLTYFETAGMVCSCPPESTPTPQSPRIITLADVTPERVAWLWPGRFPLGKLVVLDGDPSTGKSTLSLDLAAHVSTGKPWPDGAHCDAGDVLLLSAEDGLADTIAPRLVAAGADRRRVHALTEVPSRDDDGNSTMVPPTLPRDIPHLARIVADRGVTLLVVDVLMAYLNGKVDSHRDQDVRGVLHQLAAMADSTGCTIVLIRHLNKAGGSNALYRGGGSIGIVGAARAAYLVARDPDDEGRRILACSKSNLAAEPPSLAYRLVDDAPTGCARVEWEAGTVEHTASSLLRTHTDDDERDERDALDVWLSELLEDGALTANEIYRAADSAGYSKDQTKRAKKRLGITATHPDVKGPWYWQLDPKGAPSEQGSAQIEPAPLAPLGAPLVEATDCPDCTRLQRISEHMRCWQHGEAS
ncbi:AAA family ATPase [Kribbella shirazensis]|uniref:AAA family ATPase n=1 Tax=Kribbella shirazensis TaxID=1105143 RepID=A0A7X5VB69_9ACTN|nr:AAA family ATPase [Kribbella shirazensis]NIK57898.1 hypothetical protein [Kribbella shirazensis]